MSNQAGPSRPAARPTKTMITLEPSTMERFAPSRLFKEALDPRNPWTSNAHEGYSSRPQISSIAFDESGDTCFTAGEDEAFTCWDALTGVRRKVIPSRKYGISLIRTTHKSTNIIHTSTKQDPSAKQDPLEKQEHFIRYHSMHDNKYLMYMKGHSARVRSIQMHPTKDSFISAGDDGTVRIWDMRNPVCQALLNNVGGSTIAAFDTSGQVFAVASSELAAVMLYATDTPDGAPFHHARVVDPELERISQPPRQPVFTSIQFSKNGDLILLGTSSDVHYILDGFDLSIHLRLVGHQGLETDSKGTRELQSRRGGSGEEVGWTGDSRWVYSGSADGSICFWDLLAHPRIPEETRGPGHAPKTLPPTIKKRSEHFAEMGPTRAVRFNPRHAMMAVGGEQLSFMLPEKEENIEDGF